MVQGLTRFAHTDSRPHTSTQGQLHASSRAGRSSHCCSTPAQPPCGMAPSHKNYTALMSRAALPHTRAGQPAAAQQPPQGYKGAGCRCSATRPLSSNNTSTYAAQLVVSQMHVDSNASPCKKSATSHFSLKVVCMSAAQDGPSKQCTPLSHWVQPLKQQS